MEYQYVWPLPVTKNLWKVRCGGISKEIAPYAGINQEALEEKHLPLRARIEVRDYRNAFSYQSSVFYLHPLDDTYPKALRNSKNGELILPRSRDSVVKRPNSYYELQIGKQLVINVLERLMHTKILTNEFFLRKPTSSYFHN